MADNHENELAKWEAESQKQAAALAKTNAKVAELRSANRVPKLAELKEQVANYGFTAADIFGEAAHAPATAKPKTKAPSGKAKTIAYDDKQGNTWGGGKGPRPGWIKAIQEAGGDIEKYRIEP